LSRELECPACRISNSILYESLRKPLMDQGDNKMNCPGKSNIKIGADAKRWKR